MNSEYLNFNEFEKNHVMHKTVNITTYLLHHLIFMIFTKWSINMSDYMKIDKTFSPK